MKHCTNCKNFAWWDGDFCCVDRMSIIEGAPNGKFGAILPEPFNANKCKEYSLQENSAHDYETQYINFLKETLENADKETLLQKYGYKKYK